MNCADVEIVLCDYLDGTLAPSLHAEFESHLGSCALCAEFARDAGAGLKYLEHVPDAVPPQELVTRIMHHAPAGGLLQNLAGSGNSGGFRKWLSRMFEPIRQPRFGFGAMMTILSLSLMTKGCGLSVREIRAEDLNPQRVWVNLETKVERMYDRTIKTYESMRLVYEVRQELRQWREQQQEQEAAAPVESRELPVRSPAAGSGASPGVAADQPGKN
jgi:hypothetical protein